MSSSRDEADSYEERWVEIRRLSRQYGERPLFSTGRDEAERQLRADGCDGPIEFIGIRPDYEGKGIVRVTWGSRRPKRAVASRSSAGS